MEPIIFHNNYTSSRFYRFHRMPVLERAGILEIFVVLKGSAEVSQNYEKIRLLPGEWLFIEPSNVHCKQSKDGCTAVSLYLNLQQLEEHFPDILSMRFRNQAISDGSLVYKKSHQIRELQFLKKVLNLIETEIKKEDCNETFFQDKVYPLIKQIIVDFNAVYYLQHTRRYISELQIKRFLNITAYIRKHLGEKICIDDILQSENLSKNYFSQIWKEICDISFRSLLTRERLLKAEYYLIFSDKKIYEIAELCGFSDVKYFYQYFHKYYHCTQKLTRLFLVYMQPAMTVVDTSAAIIRNC